jgi:hypothetical protein
MTGPEGVVWYGTAGRLPGYRRGPVRRSVPSPAVNWRAVVRVHCS